MIQTKFLKIEKIKSWEDEKMNNKRVAGLKKEDFDAMVKLVKSCKPEMKEMIMTFLATENKTLLTK